MTAPFDLTYYNTLNIKINATDSEIKDAFRREALKWHPDKHSDKTKVIAEKNFREVTEAYVVLSDKDKRAKFDQYGQEGLKSGNPLNKDKPSPGWTFTQQPRDVFDEFFGNSNPFAEIDKGDFMFSEIKSAGVPKAAPVEANLYCSLEELYSGAVKKQKIIRQKLTDDLRSVRPEEKILTVEVQAGWKAGTKLTFPAQGDETPNMGPGDVIFTIKEKPHPRFKRDKNDLIFTPKISLLQALIGCKIDCLLLDGRTIPVAINEVVHPKFQKILTGEGMPISKKPGQKGDIIINFDVVYPQNLGIAQKEELSKLLPPL